MVLIAEHKLAEKRRRDEKITRLLLRNQGVAEKEAGDENGVVEGVEGEGEDQCCN
jgi:hypothetical protein